MNYERLDVACRIGGYLYQRELALSWYLRRGAAFSKIHALSIALGKYKAGEYRP